MTYDVAIYDNQWQQVASTRIEADSLHGAFGQAKDWIKQVDFKDLKEYELSIHGPDGSQRMGYFRDGYQAPVEMEVEADEES
jgi:hypothetical protein